MTPNADEDVKESEHSYIADGSINDTWSLWKFWLFLTKLNLQLSCDPTDAFLNIYPGELTPYLHSYKNLHKDIDINFYS